MKYTLPQLPYEFNALEQAIDAKTMEIHYGKHHQAYINNLNTVLEKYPDLTDRDLTELLSDLDNLEMENADKTTLRNNGGGHLNHALFWSIMGPEKAVDEALMSRIADTFGSVEEFKTELSEKAVKQFGSGWAWLAEDADKKLVVYSTPNQDSPYLQGHTPLIGLDVWEHAYYLRYQNLRAEYVKNWWSVLKLI